MKTKTRAALTLLAIAGLFSLFVTLYLGSWHFYFRDWRASPDPFSPEADSLYARSVRAFFSPIRSLEDARERRAVSAAGKISMQGVWEGPVIVDRRPVELRVRVSATSVFFERAPHWPELHEKTFLIEEDDGNWYFMTDLGKIYIQTPSELIDIGGSPDEMFLRTTGFLHPSEEDLKIHRTNQ